MKRQDEYVATRKGQHAEHVEAFCLSREVTGRLSRLKATSSAEGVPFFLFSLSHFFELRQQGGGSEVLRGMRGMHSHGWNGKPQGRAGGIYR